MSDDQFVLGERDRNSTLWLRLSAHLEARLVQHRAVNDNDQTPEATAKLRGRIAELKAILALGGDE